MASNSQKQHLGYDEAFENRWAIAQKIAWGVVSFFVLLGVTGVLGKGPLSKSSLALGDDAVLEYDRVLRHQAPAQLVIRLRNTTPADTRIWLARALFEQAQVSRITPRPNREIVAPDGITYEFSMAGAGAGVVVFDIVPAHAGKLAISLGVGGRQPTPVSSIILP